MLIYANNFTVVGGKESEDMRRDSSQRFASTIVFHSIAGWLKIKTGRPFSIPDLKSGREFREAGYHVQTFSADKSLPAIYAILLTEWDKQVNGRKWITEISVREDAVDSIFVSILLETQEASTQVRETPESTRPRVIDLLARNAEFAAGTIGLHVRNASNEDDFKFISMEIDKSNRTYPVILISADEGKYAVDPDFLQKQLFGLARVIRVNEDADTWNMANITGKEYAVWNGAVRIIWPSQGKHYCYTRLLLKDELAEEKRPDRAILSLITHRTNLLKKREHFSSTDVRAKRQKDYLLALRDQMHSAGKSEAQQLEEYKQLFEAAEAERDEVEQKLAQLKSEKEIIENDALGYLEERDDLKARLRDKDFQIEGLKKRAGKPVKHIDMPKAILVLTGQERLTPKLCLEIAGQQARGLVILDTALKSAEEAADYCNSPNLLAALIKLSNEFLPAYLKDGNVKHIFGTNVYAANESDQTMKNPKCIRQRTFCYRGKQIVMWPHLGWGVANNTRESMRVYFYVDQENKKIVIGHCGKHLDTIKTASI